MMCGIYLYIQKPKSKKESKIDKAKKRENRIRSGKIMTNNKKLNNEYIDIHINLEMLCLQTNNTYHNVLFQIVDN